MAWLNEFHSFTVPIDKLTAEILSYWKEYLAGVTNSFVSCKCWTKHILESKLKLEKTNSRPRFIGKFELSENGNAFVIITIL